MDFDEKKVCYFTKAGKDNSDQLLKHVKRYMEREGINNVVVASTTGETGEKTSRVLMGNKIIVVTHHYGFRETGRFEMKEDHERRILENGARIFTGTHALSSVERAIRKEFGTIGPLELIANTLRIMGEGVKVCVEITLMAADAGLIPVERDVVAIGGTGEGADTALRLKPASTRRFFDLKIKEIIAKPTTF